MDNTSEIRDFLTGRRAKITPGAAGLSAYGGNRRVTGLRREEVALLAGVSVDYYTRLERGNLRGVSGSVLEALARALQLDEAERAHLFDLAHAANAGSRTKQRRPAKQKVRRSVQHILDAMTGSPAYVRDGRMDILAVNQLGRAFLAPVFAGPERPANLARFSFLDPAARHFYKDGERLAADTVAVLRAEAGRNPYDKGLSDLIGELSTRSDLFRSRWAAHNVRFHSTVVKHFRHPVVGELTLTGEAMNLDADEGLTLIAYAAEPATPSEDALRLLASWTATPHEQQAEAGRESEHDDLAAEPKRRKQ